MDSYVRDLFSFNFNGRMNRLMYWKYILFGFILMVAVSFALGVLGLDGTGLLTLLQIIFGILCLPFSVRRAHDLNLSGWWCLLSVIPIVNFFWGIYLGFFKGTTGSNQYGRDPLR